MQCQRLITFWAKNNKINMAQLVKPSIMKSARRVFVVGVGMTKVTQILSFSLDFELFIGSSNQFRKLDSLNLSFFFCNLQLCFCQNNLIGLRFVEK